MFDIVQQCIECSALFPKAVIVAGVRLDVRGRKRCLECLPHRPQRKPRKPVLRPRRMKTCESCGALFPSRMVIEGRLRHLYRRRFCLSCSPFGIHNTSKRPPKIPPSEELIEHRRKRRNAKTYKYQKRKRKELKAALVAERGGRCESCGYDAVPAALEFHHRDAATKEFQISQYSGVSIARLRAEAAKCDLLCAICHRLRHIREASVDDDPNTAARRLLKASALAVMGGRCEGCMRNLPPAAMEFHHRSASTKDFSISADGIVRPWTELARELSKCVLLCANCHREVHAGVRSLEDLALLGLAEPEAEYVA